MFPRTAPHSFLNSSARTGAFPLRPAFVFAARATGAAEKPFDSPGAGSACAMGDPGPCPVERADRKPAPQQAVLAHLRAARLRKPAGSRTLPGAFRVWFTAAPGARTGRIVSPDPGFC